MRLLTAALEGVAVAVAGAVVLGDYPLGGSVPWLAAVVIPLLIGATMTLVWPVGWGVWPRPPATATATAAPGQLEPEQKRLQWTASSATWATLAGPRLVIHSSTYWPLRSPREKVVPPATPALTDVGAPHALIGEPVETEDDDT